MELNEQTEPLHYQWEYAAQRIGIDARADLQTWLDAAEKWCSHRGLRLDIFGELHPFAGWDWCAQIYRNEAGPCALGEGDRPESALTLALCDCDDLLLHSCPHRGPQGPRQNLTSETGEVAPQGENYE